MLPTSLALFLTLMLKAITLGDNFSRMAAEAEDTCSTVIWYVEGGYWRDDVDMYLARAEHILFPNSTAVTKTQSGGS